MAKVEFVKYTGRCPSLCTGRLYVKIDDKLTIFSGVTGRENTKTPHYPKFWTTEGGCHYYDDGKHKEKMIEKAPWKFDIGPWNKEDYPDDILRIMDELLRVMNENVEWGCCGGCI